MSDGPTRPDFMALALAEARSRRRRAARCRSAPSLVSGRRGRWPAPATGRASSAIRPPMPRCWPSARRRDSARRRAADGRRSLRHAGALHHVRGGDFVCPHPPALFRRRRRQGRRGGERRALLRLSRPATMRRRSMPASARATQPILLREFFQPTRIADCPQRPVRLAYLEPGISLRQDRRLCRRQLLGAAFLLALGLADIAGRRGRLRPGDRLSGGSLRYLRWSGCPACHRQRGA